MTETRALSPTRWINALRSCSTVAELRRSPFFRREEPALLSYLNTAESMPFPGAEPHLRRFLRAVTWNIEKGSRWREIAEVLRVDPELRAADLILLNEVDVGMARSGNVHVARELAHALRMNYVFAPAHLELTKGTGSDLEVAGENETGLQGNAILSRYPLGEARIIELPDCFDCFNFEEKRYGRRIALQATVYTDHGSLAAVGAHLEVRNTPACRARQMEALLSELGDADGRAVLLAGDWNTHTFRRGTRWRTLCAYLRIGLTQPERLRAQLLHPDDGRREVLFSELRQHGFTWDEFNDRSDTCGIPLPALEEVHLLPEFLHRFAEGRLAQHNHELRFRLDWFAGRGLRPLADKEVLDTAAGLTSVAPHTITAVNAGPMRLSDHDPILVDIRLPPEDVSQLRHYRAA